MRDDEPLSGQSDDGGEAAAAEFTRELSRVNVDWDEAGTEVFEAAPKIETPGSDDGFEVGVFLNVTALTDTLRSLPDGAGTEAFLAAFRERKAEFGTMPPDFTPPPGFHAS